MFISQTEQPQNLESGNYYCLSYTPEDFMALKKGAYVIDLTGEHRLREEIAEQAGKTILMNS